MAITIKNTSGSTLDHKFFLFPGGEIGLKLNAKDYKFIQETQKDNHVLIIANLHNSNDVITLAMAKDAIERLINSVKVSLFMPYCPYGRQDRICDGGEAFSLKVFANFINSLNFHAVTTVDPHSLVTEAVFDRLNVFTQLDVIQADKPFRDRVLKGGYFISADAGANKKTADIAKFFNHPDFIRADKLRNLATGEIKETIVYADDLQGNDVFIVDDLADKGRTFIELAKVLKTKNAGKIVLRVTHGIFSGGFNYLFDNGIDEIYTTDSFTQNFVGDLPKAPKLNIANLEKMIRFY